MSASDVMSGWRESPLKFVRECLAVEEVDDWQMEILEAARTNQRLCLKASKGPGKSAVLAWIGWWFLATRRHPKVVCTSISGDNLRDNLWSEFSKWQKTSPILTREFTWNAERIVHNAHPETWWASARQWPKSADANKQADTLAGVHADHVLFLIDEAGGIPDAVVAAAEAGLANADKEAGREALLVIAGNPTHLTGPLYRACTREKHLWWVKEISGDPDDPKRAPRISIQWAREQIDKYGRENPWVLVNVFGRFPPGQSNALLGVEEVSDAQRRNLNEHDYFDEARILGIDVARFGDDRSVLVRRQGKVVFRPQVHRNLDTMQLAGQVALLVEKWKPDAVFVDQTGIGAGVVDRLKQLGLTVIGIDFGSRPTEGKYANRRAEMWWKMADWVRAGGCLPSESEVVGELTGPTYYFKADGKLALESKEDMKSRGLSSPDIADAIALTFAAPVVPQRNRMSAKQSATTEYNPFEGRV